ncbi:MAG: hypothetical protein O7D91_05160 [Planctomycetota bacterium]|nr:hypothetical protein [Planctomycetota bacterium]
MAGSSNNKTMLIGGGVVVVAAVLVYLFAFADSGDSSPSPARPPTAMDDSPDEFDDSGSGAVERGTGSGAARSSGSRLAGTEATPEEDAKDADGQISKKKNKRRNAKKRTRKSAEGEEEEEQEDSQKVQGTPSFKGVPRGGG